MNKLNQRQENYAQLLYQGVKQIVAYKEAGFSANSTPVTIANNASRLANSDKIVARLRELNTPIIKIIQSKKEEKLGVLENIYKEKPVAGSVTAMAVVRAVSVHNDMVGDNAPVEVEAPAMYQTCVFILPDGTRVLPGDFKPKQIEGRDATEQAEG